MVTQSMSHTHLLSSTWGILQVPLWLRVEQFYEPVAWVSEPLKCSLWLSQLPTGNVKCQIVRSSLTRWCWWGGTATYIYLLNFIFLTEVRDLYLSRNLLWGTAHQFACIKKAEPTSSFLFPGPHTHMGCMRLAHNPVVDTLTTWPVHFKTIFHS